MNTEFAHRYQGSVRNLRQALGIFSVVLMGVGCSDRNSSAGVGRGPTNLIERRQVASFEAVEVAAWFPWKVEIEVGGEQSVEVRGTARPEIDAEVRDNVLYLDEKPGTSHGPGQGVTIHVTVPKLARVSAAETASVTVTGIVNAPRLELTTRGGHISAAGEVGEVRIQATAAAGVAECKVDATELRALSAHVVVQGRSTAALTATDAVTGSARGKGAVVTVSGNPKRVEVETHDGATVEKRARLE